MWNIIKHENVFSHIKMGKGVSTFGDIEIEKKNYCYKICVLLRDVDIKKVLVSNKISFSGKNYK